MAKNESLDLDVAGRLADGWAYAVTLKSGKVRRFCATRPLGQLFSPDAPAPFIVFDGARLTLEEPRDGVGLVRAEEIATVGYWGPFMDILYAMETGTDLKVEGDEDQDQDEGDQGGEPPPLPDEGQEPAPVGTDPLDRALGGD